MELTPGIYEKLINEALKKKLENLPAEYRIHYINIDPSQAPRMLTNYVASMMNNLLSNDEVFPELKDKISFVNKVVEFIHQWEINPDDDLLTNEKKLLGGIFSSIDRTEKQLKALENSRPRSGFTFNTLFTGSNHDLSIQNEINRDIISADEIYWIVAFIRFTGVRILRALSGNFSKMMAHACISSPQPTWAQVNRRLWNSSRIWILRRLKYASAITTEMSACTPSPTSLSGTAGSAQHT